MCVDHMRSVLTDQSAESDEIGYGRQESKGHRYDIQPGSYSPFVYLGFSRCSQQHLMPKTLHPETLAENADLLAAPAAMTFGVNYLQLHFFNRGSIFRTVPLHIWLSPCQCYSILVCFVTIPEWLITSQ